MSGVNNKKRLLQYSNEDVVTGNSAKKIRLNEETEIDFEMLNVQIKKINTWKNYNIHSLEKMEIIIQQNNDIIRRIDNIKKYSTTLSCKIENDTIDFEVSQNQLKFLSKLNLNSTCLIDSLKDNIIDYINLSYTKKM
jgi:hypothetical protein